MATPTWLSDIGNVLKKIFSPGAIKVEASIADILLPGFSPLINSAASSIIAAETAAAAAGMQNGTGTQKMAYATSLFQSTYNQWAAANNLTQEPAAIQALLQQVFNLIQTLQPATSSTPAPAPTTPSAALGSTVLPTAPSVSTLAHTGTLL
jgi:hypothetical protein